VAVHDAARPCTPAELVERVFAAAEKHAAVIPAVGVRDTLKRVREEEAGAEVDPIADILGTAPASGRARRRVVESTVDRAGLMAVQTPQVFERGLFERAYAQKNLDSTDDAQLVERLGEAVVVVAGDERNIKITHPGDMRLARAILGVRDGETRDAHKRF
jgi:2-C-methyl-D-erythritol 4-phosphate cytidylyltransferase